jgi:carbamoyltransferase
MIVLGIHTGHDGAAALFAGGELVAYCKEERLSRVKSDGRRLMLGAIDEVFAIAGLPREDVDVVCLSRMHMPVRYFRKTSQPLIALGRRLRGKCLGVAGEMTRTPGADALDLIYEDRIKSDLGLHRDARVMFANHHYSHVLGAFQFTTWERDALYLSCDGGGDGAYYSAYSWDGDSLSCLYGGESTIRTPQNSAASIGRAYSAVTRHLGFRANRHEGKITGLAAFGKPVLGEAMVDSFIVNADGSFASTFEGGSEWNKWMSDSARKLPREDLAASIQYATEVVMVKWVSALRDLFPARYIGMSGGVFSNVRLNQKVGELDGVEQVFVFPAMGDEGLPVGNCTHAMIETQGIGSLHRYHLPDVYLGRKYNSGNLADAARDLQLHVIECEDTAPRTAELLAEGKIGAIYSQRMEMGPRALGARSIIASPVDRHLNDSLNKRLERTEFMPFAPYVLDEDADKVFVIDDRNREACRFMTITTDVREAYLEEIPAVVHVDNTARPQVVEQATNPLYYNILKSFRDRTGIHCLVNTSFNAHEEPIINTPGEALQALMDRRIDFLVSDDCLVFPGEPGTGAHR